MDYRKPTDKERFDDGFKRLEAKIDALTAKG